MKKMILVVLLALFTGSLVVSAEDTNQKSKVSVKKASSSKYSLEVKIDNIPTGQQTLFVPIKIDTKVLDFDKVALEDVSSQNILAVASTSKDKVGTGIGLLKFDDKGLPPSLTLKVLLKPVGDGQTEVSLVKVAEEPALLARGTVINNDISITFADNKDEVEVSQKIEKGKKKLLLSSNKLSINVKRLVQVEETIFVPVIFDKTAVDLDESFGHAVVAQGVSVKTFASGSLHEGGPGVEIILSPEAEKDFAVDVDLVARAVGKAKFAIALPQKGHTALVRGPIVSINPQVITVAKVDIVKAD